LTSKFDQLRIILDWQPPESNAGLVSAYLVTRSDRGTPISVMGTHFEDAEYEADMPYTYTVTAARGEVPGLTGASTSVTTKDTTPPETPTGLTFGEFRDTGLPLQWTPNKERDLLEYRLLRSDQAEPVYRGQSELFQDPTYKPGLSYRLQAVDRSGNPSKESPATPGP
jgi:hypothetical protein